MNLLWIAGISGLITPFILFELGKCHTRRALRKNVLELENMKETANEEISALIELHLEELRKIDMGLFKSFKEK